MSCEGCRCYFCARNVDLGTEYFTPGEVDEVCFNCDDCYYFSDNNMDFNRKTTCAKYVEPAKLVESRAKHRRKLFKVINGGGT